ncbi:Membrane protein [Microbacterium esteraromaticum]|uniref:Membrane protein n=2 Tax=Microbacterium esteraromaticum TaxID=57043 RepID=A0A1R4IVL5_9MICO|nr:Membrane protein [Microbacterium esteraromaticum]
MQMNDQVARVIYRERLTPSLWMLVTIALVGPMVSLVFVPLNTSVALVLGGAVSLVLVVMSIVLSPVVSVTGSVLRAGRAHIDAQWLGEPEQFTGQDARDKRTRDIARDGWHLFRGGIDGVVVVPVTDPADPMNSWTVTTRTPDRLSAAIRSARRISAAE